MHFHTHLYFRFHFRFRLHLHYHSHFHFQLALKSAFIRGSVVRYVHVPAGAVDTQLLEDAARRGERAREVSR